MHARPSPAVGPGDQVGISSVVHEPDAGTTRGRATGPRPDLYLTSEVPLAVDAHSDDSVGNLRDLASEQAGAVDGVEDACVCHWIR